VLRFAAIRDLVFNPAMHERAEFELSPGLGITAQPGVEKVRSGTELRPAPETGGSGVGSVTA
jgi:hypothetical protein